MFLRSIRLGNYRSFLDTGTIELRPIVVLVGPNSSGKSSLLRFFPLLRQTFETNTHGPLLWYGDDVDIGDFSSALCRAAEEKRITIELSTNWLAPRPQFRARTVRDLHKVARWTRAYVA